MTRASSDLVCKVKDSLVVLMPEKGKRFFAGQHKGEGSGRGPLPEGAETAEGLLLLVVFSAGVKDAFLHVQQQLHIAAQVAAEEFRRGQALHTEADLEAFVLDLADVGLGDPVLAAL